MVKKIVVLFNLVSDSWMKVPDTRDLDGQGGESLLFYCLIAMHSHCHTIHGPHLEMAPASGVHGETSHTTEEHWRCASSSPDEFSEHPSGTHVAFVKGMFEAVQIIHKCLLLTTWKHFLSYS